MNLKDFLNILDHIRNNWPSGYQLLDDHLEEMTNTQIVTLLREPRCTNKAIRHKLYGESLARLLENTPTQ